MTSINTPTTLGDEFYDYLVGAVDELSSDRDHACDDDDEYIGIAAWFLPSVMRCLGRGGR